MSCNPKEGFTPGADLIAAAEALIVSMTMEHQVRPIVEAYEAEILARHRFCPDEKWGDGYSGEVVLDRRRTFLLSVQDAKTFYAECFKARDAAGLQVSKPGNCPLLEAQSLRIAAEKAFINRLGELDGMKTLAERVDAMTPDMRRKTIDTGLRLVAPFVGSADAILRRLQAD